MASSCVQEVDDSEDEDEDGEEDRKDDEDGDNDDDGNNNASLQRTQTRLNGITWIKSRD